MEERFGIKISKDAEITLTFADGKKITKKVSALTDEELETATSASKIRKSGENDEAGIFTSWASWFRGVNEDGKVVEKGEDYTGWANTRTALTAVAGLVGLKSIWNWLSPAPETAEGFQRRLLMEQAKARGGAV